VKDSSTEALVVVSEETKELVAVALVTREEEAKIFCEKVSKKRNTLDPSEEVISVVGVRLPERAESVVVASVEVAVTERLVVVKSVDERLVE
jgi:hypothetical protein